MTAREKHRDRADRGSRQLERLQLAAKKSMADTVIGRLPADMNKC